MAFKGGSIKLLNERSSGRNELIDINPDTGVKNNTLPISSLNEVTVRGFNVLDGDYYVLANEGLYKDNNGDLNFVRLKTYGNLGFPSGGVQGSAGLARRNNKLYTLIQDYDNSLITLYEINPRNQIASKIGNSVSYNNLRSSSFSEDFNNPSLAQTDTGFLGIIAINIESPGPNEKNLYKFTITDAGVFSSFNLVESHTTNDRVYPLETVLGVKEDTLNFTGIDAVASSGDVLMSKKVFYPDGETFIERFALKNSNDDYTGIDFSINRYFVINNTSKKIEVYNYNIITRTATFSFDFALKNPGDSYSGMTLSGVAVYVKNDTKNQIERYSQANNMYQNSWALENNSDDYSDIAYDNESIFAFNETTDKIEEYKNVNETQEVGFIKAGFKSTLNFPANLEEEGETVNPEIFEGVEVVAFYNDSEGEEIGDNLYLALSVDRSRYASLQLFQNAVNNFFSRLKVTSGDDEFEFNFQNVSSTTSAKDTKWSIIYNLKNILASSSVLQEIVENFVVEKDSIKIDFIRPSGQVYSEILTELQPNIFSVVFESQGDKESNDIKNSIVIYNETDREILNNFFIDPLSFIELDSVNNNKRFYKKTTESPLDITPEIYDFNSVNPLTSILRFINVDVNFSAAQLLKAHIYQYKCRFKWIDQKGFEHRSPFSDIITIYSNRHIGTRGNQPTFELNNLHLTNKPNQNLTIEVYRTENLLQTFKLIKEVKNDQEEEKTIIRDDVIDENLGQVADPSNTTISGAKFNIKYKGRFVLYGFPEKPNRIVVSSPLSNFSNKGIDFKNQGFAGDLVELLMDEEVICVRQMDQHLIIFCKETVYSWTLNESSVDQRIPQEITGLVDLNATNSRSAKRTNTGLIFNSTKGLWTLSRGLSGEFTGKDVQDLEGNILEIENIRDSQEIRIITDDNNFPILNYNYRFRLFSTYDEGDVVSSCIWKDKYTVVNKRGDIKTEIDTFDYEDIFSFQTGWMNFHKIQGFQRFRDFYFLAEFLGLKNLTCRIYYDFNNVLYEEILYDLSNSLKDQAQFRFQPRKQQCRSVRLELEMRAKKARLFGFLIGLTALPGVYLRSSQQQIQPGG